MYTHTHTNTQREICNHVLEGKKNSSKGLNFNKKVKKKPQKVLIVASFEGDDEKA